MKVSDYVVQYLVDRGITDLFLVSGGNIMHLLDSVGRNSHIRYISNYHEQASAIAAEAWARIRNKPGVCLVTTGPGSANALSGVIGAWFDSIPVVVLSGQVRVPLLADYSRIRQFGPQEMNTIPMVRPVTKYASQVRDPLMIRKELDRVFQEASAGRPGPAWLDLPLDVQAATIDESKLAPIEPRPDRVPRPSRESVRGVADRIRRARRPVLVAGNGIRLAGADPLLQSFLARVRLPVLLPIGSMDLVSESYPLCLGAFGPFGRRASNFALQNSDLFLSIGAGLSVAAIGFNTQSFAPRATKIVVNIDPGELEKPTVSADLKIEADAGEFLAALLEELASYDPPARWTEACLTWKRTFPPGPPPELLDPRYVNSYRLCEELSTLLAPGDIVVAGNSLDCCSVYQSLRIHDRQRVLINANCGAMGWDLPAAIGAAVAAPSARVALVTGDGSIQFNAQELQTVGYYKLPIKIFILNNQGYESIRSTQTNYFEGRFVGSDSASGVTNPDFRLLAAAHGIPYAAISSPLELADGLASAMKSPSPLLCEVLISPEQPRTPRVSSYRKEDGTLEARPIEDMFPYLSREEVSRNMHLFDDEAPP